MDGDGSQKARHARGLDVYETIRGDGADLEKLARAMEKGLGALGTFSIDHVLGDIWARPQLARRDRSLVSVSALVCLGAEAELKTHVGGALNHGVTAAEIDEVMLQLSAYAGYPRAYGGFRVASGVIAERAGDRPPHRRAGAEPKNDAQRRADGVEAWRRLSGTDLAPDAVAKLFQDTVGDVGRFALDYLFGEIWSRPDLSRRDRSLVTLSALVTLGKVAELEIHVPGALRHELRREEIEELILQLTLYAGYPAAVEAIRAARAIFAREDAGA